MATYAVGDVQGCFVTLQKLLARVGFDPAEDRLWLVGDLVNRGPASLEALRWAKSLGDRLVMVLGNHEMHLLARAAGVARPRARDTLDDVLAAPDRDALLGWLRERPFVHRDTEWVLVHGGLLPGWTVDDALALSEETSLALRGPLGPDLLRGIRTEPPAWSDDLRGLDRVRTALAAFTRLRVCTRDGRMDLDHDGPPETAPAGFFPWFEIPRRRSADHTVVFGHWAALGLCVGDNVFGLDSGCSWGRTLTALRLDDRALFEEPLADKMP